MSEGSESSRRGERPGAERRTGGASRPTRAPYKGRPTRDGDRGARSGPDGVSGAGSAEDRSRSASSSAGDVSGDVSSDQSEARGRGGSRAASGVGGGPRVGGRDRGGRDGGGRGAAGRGGAPRSGGDRAGRPARVERAGSESTSTRAPEIPADVDPRDLDRSVRGRLRTLSKDNADGVAGHLIMAGRLIDSDPELAYEHAMAAVKRAGRVDVVREAAGLAAYHTGRYAEALRELRTVRRLSGSAEHLPVMADCERGLGRPERALALGKDPDAGRLDAFGQVELAIVLAGARMDLGEPDGALATLGAAVEARASAEQRARISLVRADALEAAGRDEEAASLRSAVAVDLSADEELVVIDLDSDDDGPTDGMSDNNFGGPEVTVEGRTQTIDRGSDDDTSGA